MKALITGGTGFIGCRLAMACRDQGQDVVVLGQVNNPVEEFRQRQLTGMGIDVAEIPIDDADALRSKLAGCATVYHLAAAQHEANVPDQYFYDVNVEGTRNILEASIDAGVSRFVHGSTIGVYGSALAGEIDESSTTAPDNIYGVTKLKGEQLVLDYADRLPVTVIRISETYGPGDGRLLKLFKAIKKRAFFVIGDGENIHQLIYVDDLVNGLMTAAQRPAAVGETFVLAGTERLTTTAMCAAVAGAVSTPLRGIRAPLWPFLAAAVVMEKTLGPLGIQPPLHRRRLDFFRKSFYFDQAKVREVLGFVPATSFSAGTRLTAAWYAQNDFL